MNKKIVASLRFGRVNSLLVNLICTAFAILGVSLFIIMSLISLPKKDWIMFAVEFILGLFFLIFGAYKLIIDLIIKKRIRLWQTDAVKLGAYSEKISSDFSIIPFVHNCVAIAVRFEYHDKKIRKVSGRHGNLKHNTVFYRYCDRKITILYSPKYDEVMILKD